MSSVCKRNTGMSRVLVKYVLDCETEIRHTQPLACVGLSSLQIRN